jgi:PiT family inorganic phosphate transporter
MIATFKELPISASHGIIGGLMGVGIAAKGWDSIGVDNVIKAVISWITSPAVGLVCSMLICWTVEKTVSFIPSLLAQCA